MKSQLLDQIARAVLYEGYMLYPYRPSSVKNQQRFNFGVLTPKAYSMEERNREPWSMQTECLVLKRQNATLEVKVRFLHLLARETGEQIWQEAIERETAAMIFNLEELIAGPQRLSFAFTQQQKTDPLLDPEGRVTGTIIRKQEQIEGAVEIEAQNAGDLLYRVTVRILNLTPFENADKKSRQEALMQSLVSAHTVLSVRETEFVSLLEPPEEFCEAVAGCNNIGTWPVLVGEEGERDLMLSSPIILYDYPKIAPESAGDLFDGTEIDEILTLRIMTLTEEEKREMRQVDERTRQILERTESLTAEQLLKLHGRLK